MEKVGEGWKSETKVGFALRSYFITPLAKHTKSQLVLLQNSMNKKIKLSYISSSPADLTKWLTDTEPITYSVV